LPSPSIDWTKHDGRTDIPIERRSPEEVTHVRGLSENGTRVTVRIAPEDASAVNYGFDVTPARFVTGLITERGTVDADEEALASLFPDLT
jgi:methylthioribose-1-phosphate isomerase